MSGPALPDAATMAVLRPNALGDFLFCLPALHALRATYPRARMVFIGQRWHADFLAGRPGPVDEVAVLPPWPGIGMPPQAESNSTARSAFIAAMRDQRFDLALQMFGGGRYANPLVRQLGARFTVGMKALDAVPLDRWLPYEGVVNRRLQLLEVASLAGASAWPMDARLSVTAADIEQAAQLIAPSQGEFLVMLQPGASDARRRWPPARFAAVADALAGKGACIAVNGTAAEAPLIGAVIAAMRHPAIDLSGKASLQALCGLLARTALLVSNDTGPLHLALAIGAPAVGIYWLTNLIESGPLQQQGHRAALSLRVHCPLCGMENIKARCAHDVSFVDDVPQEEVIRLCLELLGQQRAGMAEYA